jgi:hypothetical protein
MTKRHRIVLGMKDQEYRSRSLLIRKGKRDWFQWEK